jgi:two-component system LytT family sensor kinase
MTAGNKKNLWLLGIVTWTVLGLMSAAQNAAWRAFSGRRVDWLWIVPNALADWYTCAVFSPAFFWMVRRFPIRGARWWTRLPPHLGASIVFTLLKVALYTPLYRMLNPQEPQTYQDLLVGGFYADLLAYWAAIGVIHAILYYVQTARLDGALRAAELENLRAQLQPHFLFNTLQSISTLIHRDPRAADRMLADLSDLLRLSLRNPPAQEVPLREELGFLERYLAIMRVRFGDRLAIHVEAPEGLLDARVPSLVLQPITENAIRHGMADRPDIGHVTVRAVQDGDTLLLEVTDDGPGLSTRPATDGGIGLANTRERIARLYGGRGEVRTLEPSGGGVTVRLTIPLRVMPDD